LAWNPEAFWQNDDQVDLSVFNLAIALLKELKAPLKDRLGALIRRHFFQGTTFSWQAILRKDELHLYVFPSRSGRALFLVISLWFGCSELIFINFKQPHFCLVVWGGCSPWRSFIRLGIYFSNVTISSTAILLGENHTKWPDICKLGYSVL
jgi:hypothetical protein